MEPEDFIPFTPKEKPVEPKKTFKEELELAITWGCGEDWGWDAESGDEVRVDTFDPEAATEKVLELLKKHGISIPE